MHSMYTQKKKKSKTCQQDTLILVLASIVLLFAVHLLATDCIVTIKY